MKPRRIPRFGVFWPSQCCSSDPPSHPIPPSPPGAWNSFKLHPNPNHSVIPGIFSDHLLHLLPKLLLCCSTKGHFPKHSQTWCPVTALLLSLSPEQPFAHYPFQELLNEQGNQSLLHDCSISRTHFRGRSTGKTFFLEV